MNASKLMKKFLFVITLLFVSLNVYAEKMPFRVVETSSSQISLADDGTGLVKNIHCYGCKFNFVKITKNSKASHKGVEVSIFDVKKLKKTIVTVSFNPLTHKVLYIRW